MQTDTRALALAAAAAGRRLAALPGDRRAAALKAIAQRLRSRAETIFDANRKDLERAEQEGLAGPALKRLRFDAHKLNDVCTGLDELARMDDPVGRVQMKTELADGLVLARISCPIGVVGVIFESRPDALVQIAGLCLKSGNAVLLKGGREALGTNTALFEAMCDAAEEAGIPDGWAGLLTTREDVNEMLKLDGYIDLIIPRGSNAFVRYIMENSRIPVLGHSDGVCHVYLHEDADAEMAARVCTDAKAQYPAACNAAETLLVHKGCAERVLPTVCRALQAAGVTVRGDERTREIVTCETADETDFGKEYSDLIISVKVVDDVDEAIEHINRLGSHHTDAILTQDEQTAERFFALVDSAGVYQNCSTRFADGYRYGFGAEVGIATGKIHARGPMGLEGLCSYKYILRGHGDLAADFVEGRRSFTHKKQL